MKCLKNQNGFKMTGITLGDANGVGPEILLKAFQEKSIPSPAFVIGDWKVLEFCRDQLSVDLVLHRMQDFDDVREEALNVYDLGLLSVDDLSPGKLSGKIGKASLEYVTHGVRMALEGKIKALVTLPIHKEAVRITHKDFTGHTGYIAGLCKVKTYTMMLASEKLVVTHVSTHVALREAINQVKKERLLDVIRLTHEALVRLGKGTNIAVAGLNPHAGENNAFGKEDSLEIAPAVEMAIKAGINTSGPHPPDTVFHQAIHGKYDAVVCMYHDQGHIPMKLLDFESGVNITLGLPFLRTSVDHGTAFDIAYQGIASTKSFVNACHYALKLMENPGQPA
jgi:4-hydroxythreonine-4-phosphate dehydrogenase